MLRFIVLLCCFVSVVFAQTCPKDKSKAESLYEKYCDPTEQLSLKYLSKQQNQDKKP